MPFTVRSKCRAVEDFVDGDVDANIHSERNRDAIMDACNYSEDEAKAVEELLDDKKWWADMTKEEKKLMSKYVVQMNRYLRRWQTQLDTYEKASNIFLEYSCEPMQPVQEALKLGRTFEACCRKSKEQRLFVSDLIDEFNAQNTDFLKSSYYVKRMIQQYLNTEGIKVRIEDESFDRVKPPFYRVINYKFVCCSEASATLIQMELDQCCMGMDRIKYVIEMNYEEFLKNPRMQERVCIFRLLYYHFNMFNTCIPYVVIIHIRKTRTIATEKAKLF
jgi:hypothetical protein